MSKKAGSFFMLIMAPPKESDTPEAQNYSFYVSGSVTPKATNYCFYGSF